MIDLHRRTVPCSIECGERGSKSSRRRGNVPNSSESCEGRPMAPQPLAFGPFVLDLRRGVLLREGRPLAAGHRGLSLLHALLQAPGQVLPKDTLIQSAWPDVIVEESNLTVQIATLRKLLGPQADGSQWIATVPR